MPGWSLPYNANGRVRRLDCAPAASVATPVRIGEGVAGAFVLAICIWIELCAVTGLVAHRLYRRLFPIEIRPHVGAALADHLFRGISRSSRSFLFTDPTCRSSAMAISRAPIFLRTIALRRPNSASDQSCGRAGFFRLFFGGGSDVAWLTESPSGGPASYSN